MMKYIKVIMSVVTFLSIVMTSSVTFAQTPSEAEKKVNELLQKYDGKDGIDGFAATKGNGLELMKMMFRKQFGKDFMKGVTKITFIDYSSASENTCNAIKKDLDAFKSILEEFELEKEPGSDKHQYTRSFASVTESNTLSDFVVAFEDDSSKILMHMAGKIVVE